MNEIKMGICFDALKDIQVLDTSTLEYQEPTPEELAAQEEEQRKQEEYEKAKRLKDSGIGERYKHTKLEDYNCDIPERKAVLEKVKEFINDYRSKTMWMVGNPGTGKTMCAAMICRECWGSHYCKSYQINIELDDCKSFKAVESRASIIKKYSDYPLLVIDEIGKFESKEEVQYLFMIINERYEKNNSTVLISNKSKKELADYLGQSVYDRFTENCMSIEFNFDSYRINKRG